MSPDEPEISEIRLAAPLSLTPSEVVSLGLAVRTHRPGTMFHLHAGPQSVRVALDRNPKWPLNTVWEREVRPGESAEAVREAVAGLLRPKGMLDE